jgi:hypothetical protein
MGENAQILGKVAKTVAEQKKPNHVDGSFILKSITPKLKKF